MENKGNNGASADADQALVNQAPTGLGPSGFDPSRVVHLRNGRAQRHPHTYGDGATWCGKKLLGKPESAEGFIETFLSYGAQIHASSDPELGTCARCRDAFDTAYNEAFPEGLKPIATFRLDDPASVERARKLIGLEALQQFFGPGGGGMAAFDAALQTPDPSAHNRTEAVREDL